MATTNRGYETPATGSFPGTWADNVTNPNFDAIDQNLGGVSSIGTTGGTTVLNAAQYANGTIIVSGTLASNATIVFPAVQGWWSVLNSTISANFSVIVSSVGATESIAVPPGQVMDIQVNGTVVQFRNLPPVGTYLDYAVSSVPGWITSCTKPPYLNCDGSSFSAVTYPVLNLVLGGTTLPDLRGISRATLNQGTSRITSAVSGLDGNTIFAIKTLQSYALLTANLPPYTPAGTATFTGNPMINVLDNIGSSSTPGGGFSINQIASQSSPTPTGTVTFTGTPAPGQISAPFSLVGPTAISGITLIRAA